MNIQNPAGQLLVPIGGGYSNLETGFMAAVIHRTPPGDIKILVLPIAYASDPLQISPSERANDLIDAQSRRAEVEQACRAAAPAGATCSVALAPVFVRRDAESIPIPEYFPTDLAGVFILGGDQTVAMQVIAETPLEKALSDAYGRGVVVSGTSAGAAVQSYTMIGGYNDQKDAINSFEFGVVDVWLPPERRGLPFGIQSAVLDQHFYERGRFARLLNAISLPESPHLGVGVDAETGVELIDARLAQNIFGDTSVAILDAETYHSAEAIQYSATRNIISLRNVLVHLLPPGAFTYDLSTRVYTAQPPPPQLERTLSEVTLPDGAGPLYLAGDLSQSLAGNPILIDFVNVCGGKNAHVLILASGYRSRAVAQRDAGRYAAALGVHYRIKVITPDDQALEEIPTADGGTTGIILIGRDQALIQPDLMPAVRDAWLAGTPVLADNAGTAIVGRYYTALEPTPDDETKAGPFTQGLFIAGNLPIRSGLGFVEADFEPRLLGNNRWGRLFALAYNYPTVPAIGIAEGAAVVFTSYLTEVHGENAVAILDLRQASLALGDNRAYGIANGLLDIFAPGDPIRLSLADQSFNPVQAATPVLNTPTPLTPTATPSPTPIPEVTVAIASPAATAVLPTQRNPRATPTRIFISPEAEPVLPPPTDPNLLRAMIGFGTAAVVTVLVAVWINRNRMNMW